MGIARRLVCLFLAGPLAAVALALVPSPPSAAGATVLTVTTTDDVVDAGDGLLSLREAVQQASAEPATTGIALAEGATYVLDTCPTASWRGALSLDLDHAVVLDGSGAEVVQTCDDARVLDVQGESEAAALELRELTLRSSASEPDSLVWTDVPTTVDDVTFTGGFGGPVLFGGAGLQVRSSTFDELHGNSFVVFGVHVALRDTVISNSSGDIGVHAEQLQVDGVELVGNELASNAVIALQGLDVDGLTLRNNTGLGAGALLAGAASGTSTTLVEPFVVRDSVFVGNESSSSNTWEECCPLLGFADVDAEVTGTSLVANAGFRFAIATHRNEEEAELGGLVVTNSTVGPQLTPMQAGIRGLDDLVLNHVSVGGNTAEVDGSAEVQAGALAASGVLVGGDAESCAVGSTTSHGGNADRDDTCGFDQANDRPGEGDLSDGYTQPDPAAPMPVWLPTGSAEGVDLIPAADCPADLALDQLGRPRPQGSGCDAGAVELLQPFSDVPVGHPFFDDVAWLVAEGITTGFEDGTFRPARPVSRQAMVAFLHRLAGAPPVAVPSPPTFVDVGPGHPFRLEVEWAAAEGVADGFVDRTFRPSLPVSRQAAAAFLHRLAGAPDHDLSGPPRFSDVGPGHPFRPEVEWLAGIGITEGYVDGTFRPGNPVSRQAMAAFLHRFSSLPG